jgi:7-cyano-7-deazaguanine synthase
VKEMKDKAIILTSGGMDSATLLYYVIDKGYDAYAVSFDYGQRHKIELTKAKKICKKLNVPHIILDMSVLNKVAPSALTRKNIKVPEGHYADDNMKITVVPNRNMCMLSIAASYAMSIGAKKLFFGSHNGDAAIYFDCRPKFVAALNKAIGLADWRKVKLETPFINMSKAGICKLGLKLNVPYKLTHSCYKGGKVPCGRCATCVERTEAFVANHAIDPAYGTPKKWERAVEYMQEVTRK